MKLCRKEVLGMKNIGIVGAGMMGAEIALCFATAGFETVMSDISVEVVQNGKERQIKILDKLIKKGKMSSSEKRDILARIHITDEINYMANCDVVIEAASEDFQVKSKIYKELDRLCHEDTIIASNTSSMSITKLASAVSELRQKRFIGMHFNSPASVMKLVEVIPGLLTDDNTVDITMTLLNNIKKIPIKVKDVTGFALNRIFHCMYLEACRLVEEGVCSVEDVDNICLYGLGHPIGIFRLLDITGHDLNLAVDQIMFDAYGERFRPSPAIQRLVDSNRLGRKTGVGFYEY